MLDRALEPETRTMQGDPKPDYLRQVPSGPVREIKKASYRSYMQSDAWQKQRRRVINKARGKCAACGRKGRHVHHVSYERRFKENPTDLVLLCGRCHRLFHETYRVSKDMRAETKEFIAEMKRAAPDFKEADRLDAEFRLMFPLRP